MRVVLHFLNILRLVIESVVFFSVGMQSFREKGKYYSKLLEG